MLPQKDNELVVEERESLKDIEIRDLSQRRIEAARSLQINDVQSFFNLVSKEAIVVNRLSLRARFMYCSSTDQP